MNNIDSIVIHCSATPEGRDVTAKDIDGWHRSRGFDCIGYHYVVRLDGTIETGRPLTKEGAHCNTRGHSRLAYNRHSVGICYVGGYDRRGIATCDTRTPAQKQALIKLIKELVAKYPIKEILGHRDCGAAKACPCFDAASEYSQYLKK